MNLRHPRAIALVVVAALAGCSNGEGGPLEAFERGIDSGAECPTLFDLRRPLDSDDRARANDRLREIGCYSNSSRRTDQAGDTDTRQPGGSTAPTFAITAADYIDQFNTIQVGVLQIGDTSDGPTLGLEMRERDWPDGDDSSRLYGGPVRSGVRVYIVAAGLDQPVQSAIVTADIDGGTLTTPAQLLAAVGSNLFTVNSGDAATLASEFLEKVIPQLNSISAYTETVELGLADFRYRTSRGRAVWIFVPPGADEPPVLNLPTVFPR